MRVRSLSRVRWVVAFILVAPVPGFGEEVTTPASSEVHVREFVRQEYLGDFPREEARRLGAGAVPHLARMLRSDSEKPYWGNIVQAIGYTAVPEGFEPLRGFIEDRFAGEVDRPTYRAISAALTSLGPVATHSPAALAFLIAGTDPQHWTKVRWTCQHRRGVYQQILLSKLAINALSMSGTQKAEDALVRLQAKPYAREQRSNIEEGIARNREIMTLGLEAYISKVRTSSGVMP